MKSSTVSSRSFMPICAKNSLVFLPKNAKSPITARSLDRTYEHKVSTEKRLIMTEQMNVSGRSEIKRLPIVVKKF